jgi:hypothetical protein
MPAPVRASTITPMPMVMIQKLHISKLCARLGLASRAAQDGHGVADHGITTST